MHVCSRIRWWWHIKKITNNKSSQFGLNSDCSKVLLHLVLTWKTFFNNFAICQGLSIGFAMKFTSNQACIQNKTAKNKNKKILLRLIYDKLVQHANVSIHQGPKTLRHMVHKCCLHLESINVPFILIHLRAKYLHYRVFHIWHDILRSLVLRSVQGGVLHKTHSNLTTLIGYWKKYFQTDHRITDSQCIFCINLSHARQIWGF